VRYAQGVRLQAVGKRYGARQPWVVRNVTLDIPAGRLIRLEGRNGSGKSTLLKVLAGVSLPSAGRVTGRPHTGYVPERFPGGLPFPARDYLLHMARVHGLGARAGAAAVDEWLERLGASGYAAITLGSLSKGMCQKVAIAQALLARPGLLVLDEAWTGLDQAARWTLELAVAERAAEGGTVVFVDHDPSRLAGQANERWHLDGTGRLALVPGDHAPPPGARGPAGGPVVVIELDGLEPGPAERARGLPGVLGCDGPALRVAAGCSDDVLRTVLSWDGVHVRAVHGAGPPQGLGGAWR
jgi:ABC-type Mn2+/Zn2+ transport system ATPase subunit